MKPEFWRFLAVAFGVGLAFSVFLNVAWRTSLPESLSLETSHGKTLIFFWDSKEQKIVDGTLMMEVFLDWETVPENFTLVVRVNDDDMSTYDAVGLKLDVNADNQLGGKEDNEYVFLAMNKYYPPWYAIVTERIVTYPLLAPYPSPYHRHTYDNRTGHTFTISFPKDTINFQSPMLTLLVYHDNSLGSFPLNVVSVQFKVT